MVIRWIRAYADFWADFWADLLVGEDWTVAATVLAALLATWGLHRAGLPAWWLLPPAAIGSTTVSLRRAATGARPLGPLG
jgi:hypothetical protein